MENIKKQEIKAAIIALLRWHNKKAVSSQRYPTGPGRLRLHSSVEHHREQNLEDKLIPADADNNEVAIEPCDNYFATKKAK